MTRLRLPTAAREQVTIALEMIDAIDIQLVPFDVALRRYARKQPGCQALIEQIYGIGELTAITLLAELGDARRFPSSWTRSATQDSISRSISQTSAAHPATSRAKDHPRCVGRYMKPRNAPGSLKPRPRLLPPARPADRRQPSVPRARPQTAQTQLPHLQSPRRRRHQTRRRLTTVPPGRPQSIDEPWPTPGDRADLQRGQA